MNRSNADKILHHLRSRQQEMLHMLTQAARIESPSELPETQTPVYKLFSAALSDIGFRCRLIAGKTSGGQLLAVPKVRSAGTPIQLLMGHVDTVWPLGTLETMPVESREGKLHGPGVYDMKGGLVQAIFALATLKELGLQPAVRPIFFMNSDEEIGSHDSVAQIRRLARIADRAFVMEPSLGPEGKLKTARKGVGRFVIRVSGVAAHAGLDPEKGISAILELSHVVQTLFALNDPDQGITVNVGTIDGGMRPNVVAPESRAEVDVRVRTQQDAEWIERSIHSIAPTVPGTELSIEGHIGRPPLERTPGNQRLWQRAVDAAETLRLDVQEGAAGGGSDGNWTSLDTPTLDGLGAVGDGAHAVIEHVIEDRMPERAALLACLLLDQTMNLDRRVSGASNDASSEDASALQMDGDNIN
ncbi:MAG: M20 family metallopeptidase [Rubripirellula sp.]